MYVYKLLKPLAIIKEAVVSLEKSDEYESFPGSLGLHDPNNQYISRRYVGRQEGRPCGYP